MSKISYKFKDGTEITGTIEKIETMAKAIGEKLDYSKFGAVPRGYYPSESRGLTKISGMNEYHLRRALLKRGKDYLAEIYDAAEPIPMFLKKFVGLGEDQIIEDLYTELHKRK